MITSTSPADSKPATQAAAKTPSKPARTVKTPVKASRQKAATSPKSKTVKATAAPVTSSTAPVKTKTSPTKPLQAKVTNPKKPAAPAKAAKDKKVKVVRDSFTLPKSELMNISDMKKRAMGLGVEVKKSELIRAGLLALAAMADAGFKKAMSNVPTIKTGRPAKN
jgi:hypothetical protein